MATLHRNTYGKEDATNFPALPIGWHQIHLSSLEKMPSLIDNFALAMAENGYAKKDIFGMRLALEEALVNAIKHGHQNDLTKTAEVRYVISNEHVLVDVEDQGPGFDPQQVPDPTAAENLEKPSGRGLLSMRSLTTLMHYNERGNCVTLCMSPSKPLSAKQESKTLPAETSIRQLNTEGKSVYAILADKQHPRGHLWFALDNLCREFRTSRGLEEKEALEVLIAVFSTLLAQYKADLEKLTCQGDSLL
jgi:serine/threonine-protein kinase RsbW